MSLGDAHQTVYLSYMKCANTNGAPMAMPPAPLVKMHRTRRKSTKLDLKEHRIRSVSPNGMQEHCLSLYLQLPSDISVSPNILHHLYHLYISISRLIQNGVAHQSVWGALPIDMEIV
jgi:hypothetical protein